MPELQLLEGNNRCKTLISNTWRCPLTQWTTILSKLRLKTEFSLSLWVIQWTGFTHKRNRYCRKLHESFLLPPGAKSDKMICRKKKPIFVNFLLTVCNGVCWVDLTCSYVAFCNFSQKSLNACHVFRFTAQHRLSHSRCDIL